MITDQNGSRYINVNSIFKQLSLYFIVLILTLIILKKPLKSMKKLEI